MLLPALPPPKVTGLGSGEDRSVNFTVSVNEDEKKIIKLQDFVSFEEDPSTVERLPEFQQSNKTMFSTSGFKDFFYSVL